MNEKNSWIVGVIIMVVVILLAIFLSGNSWNKDQGPTASPSCVSSDNTGIDC